MDNENNIIFTSDSKINEALVINSFKKIKKAKEIKKGVYKVTTKDSEKYLYKFSRVNRNEKSKYIVLNYFMNKFYEKNFTKEIEVNKIINELKDISFNSPRMISFNNELIVFEFIESSIRYPQKEEKYNKDIVNFILEFKRINFNFKEGKIRNVIYNASDSIIYFRNFLVSFKIFFPDSSYKKYYQKYCSELNIHKKTSNFSYNHNDLAANILVDDETSFFVDYEGVSQTKYYLEDLISCAIDLTNFNVNRNMIELFFEKTSAFKNTKKTIPLIKREIRLILMRACVRGIRSKTKSDKYKRNQYDFFVRTLFPDKAYNEWFIKNLNCNIKLEK